MKTNDFDAVVLANGDYPVADIPLRILTDAPFVACCDGAVEELLRHGEKPDVVVGDCDSLPEALRQSLAEHIVRISEQETNDLTKTVTHVAGLGKKNIAIVGATGKREDHTLGNISLLIEYMRSGLNVRMYTDHGVFIPCTGTQTFACTPHQQVSIFSFGTKGMHSEGLVYPISDFTNWWQGTLNETKGESFSIHAKGDYLIFLNY